MRKIKSINDIASIIANREKGKKQVGIGNIREVLRLLGELLAENEEADNVFTRYKITKMRGSEKDGRSE